MKSALKNTIKSVLIFFHLDVTKNILYDRLTNKILKENLSLNSNCIDVGCHKGEILDIMLGQSPKGKHIGFEPIPYLFNNLVSKFKGRATIYPYALSEEAGSSTFQLVKNAPAYSGLKKRRYDIDNPDIEEINVEVKTLDSLIPEDQKVDFIKIDVEGGELGVLKGAKNLLKKNQPKILFECGKGASEFYGNSPKEIYSYISDEIGLQLFTLKAFIKSQQALNLEQFESHYQSNSEYYFIAAPKS